MRATGMKLLAAAMLTLAVAGCSSRAERRAHRGYHDVFGPEQRRVELNTATHRELARLPGLSDEDADRIIAHRPYGSVQGLLRKGVIGERKYEQVEDYVYVSDRGRRERDRNY